MYDEHSVQIPQPDPSQKPTPKPRSLSKAYRLVTTQHANKRMQEREYTAPQVLQTFVHGQEQQDPRGNPDVSHYVLNSIAHAQTRRRVVVDNAAEELLTVYPREDVSPPQTPSTTPKHTKANQKAQKAKKRARTNG